MKITFNKFLGFFAVASYDERMICKEAGFTWDREGRRWGAANLKVALKLEKYFDAAARQEADRLLADAAAIEQKEKETAGVALAGINPKLFGYQQEGVAHLLKNKRALLGDEMGLGKTVQVIEAARLSNAKSVLVVCPASLRLNWAKEVQMWGQGMRGVVRKKAEEVEGTLRGGGVVIVSYETMRKISKQVGMIVDILVFDEAHKLKSGKTQQGKAGVALAGALRSEARCWLLTGTPILNRPKELWNQLSVLGKEVRAGFGDWKYFHVTFCDGKNTRFGWDVDGASNLGMLQERLVQYARMLRRKKADVLDLPAIMRRIVPLDVNSMSKRDMELTAAVRGLSLEDAMSEIGHTKGAFEEMSALRYEAGMAKVKASIEYIKEVHEDCAGPVVVFAHHADVVDGLKEGLENCATITGKDSPEARQAVVEAFQAGRLDYVICSITAASTGLTLTRANQVVVVEGTWDPGTLAQAEARCHRIGSKENVQVHYLVADGGLDAYMLTLCLEKMAVIGAAVDGEKKSLEESEEDFVYSIYN